MGKSSWHLPKYYLQQWNEEKGKDRIASCLLAAYFDGSTEDTMDPVEIIGHYEDPRARTGKVRRQ